MDVFLRGAIVVAGPKNLLAREQQFVSTVAFSHMYDRPRNDTNI